MVLKLDKTSILYVLILLPFIEPQIFKIPSYAAVDKFFLVLKLFSSLIIFARYFIRDNIKISKYVILMSLVQIITGLSTILNPKGSLTRYCGPAMISVVMIMYGELMFEKNWKTILIYIEKILDIYFILNVISLLFTFIGITSNRDYSFLGIENRWIYTLLPWLIISLINSYIKDRKISVKAWSKVLLTIISFVSKWSVGAMIAIFVFVFVLLLNKRILNNRLTYIVFLVIDYLLVNQIILKLFSAIFVDYLNKDITLSGRTFLWNTVLKTLSESPLLGMGVMGHNDASKFFERGSGGVIGTYVNHPHNHLLNVAFHGGYISLVIFLLIVYLVMKDLDNIKNRQIQVILSAGVIALFVSALVDTMDFSLFYFLIPLIGGLEKIYGPSSTKNNIIILKERLFK